MFVALIAIAELMGSENQHPLTLESSTVRYTAAKQGGEWVEKIEAKDAQGRFRLVCASPTSGLVQSLVTNPRNSALIVGGTGLYESPPSLKFSSARAADRKLILRSTLQGFTITKTVSLTQDGLGLDVRIAAECHASSPKLQQMLSAYAFVPDGQAQSKYHHPDATFAPQLRPGQENVIGDHTFRAPFVNVQTREIAVSLVPSLDTLQSNRAMPTILDLDCKNGVIDAPIIAFGFCNYQLAGHVYFVRKPAARSLPKKIAFAYTLLPTAQAAPFAAYAWPIARLWHQYGSRNFRKVLPQVMPWDEYAKVCYPAAFAEKYGSNTLGWFEQKIGDHDCGGICAGWGFERGWVSWQCWFNNLRSAWGMRAFGERLNNPDWIDKADKMLNLALAAPVDRGAFPTTYDSRTHEWIGCLVKPRADAYYDLPSMAWKGIWLIEWLKFNQRSGDIKRVCRNLASFFVEHQASSGAYPAWMTKDFQPVHELSASASSALPAWFLLMWNEIEPNDKWLNSAKRAGGFLIASVIRQQKYYDFETFFSCSPKPCLDEDEPMRDVHTRLLPQNTLCMQWCAEAMRMLFETTRDEKYKTYGLMALDMMNAYQNIWSPPWITSAYTFGGFGVQNSDGEHLDARQAQFGVTNFEWGVLLQQPEYCERGVAAVRAAMTLINHPLHERNNLYPEPNYPLGLQPENVAHGGSDHQAGRTGFDWGEGSGLASAAYLLTKYGSAYAFKNARSAIGIDAVVPVKQGGSWSLITPINLLPAPWLSTFQCQFNGKSVTARQEMGVSNLRLRLESNAVVGNLNAFASGPATLEILCTNDDSLDMSSFPIETSGIAPVRFPLSSLREYRLRLRLRQGGAVTDKMLHFVIDPEWNFDNPEGWTCKGNIPSMTTESKRRDFGASGSRFIGTCEDGLGGYDDSFTCEIESPCFFSTKPHLAFLIGGGSGSRTYLALVDAGTNEILLQARGQNDEKMREVKWDISRFGNRMLKIRIVDRELGPWGHINVDRIRTEN